MKALKDGVAAYATELVMAAGAALVSLGAGMIYLPAGVIAAGAFLLAGAVLSCLGGGKA